MTVFDRKEVTPLSDHSLNFLSGDFFNKIPSDYDLYILKNILHDWEDDKAFQILKNISQAMKRDSRLLISEILIEEGKDSGKSLDLLMMVLFSGKERTQKQFKTLAAKAGLSLEIKVATVEKVDILIFKKIES